jgi:G:T/U-mismatch repair DNA glycosylase
VGITDIVQSCVHKDQKSDDKSLDSIEPKPLKELLSSHKKISTLLYTSGFVVKQVNEFADKKCHENWAEGLRKEGAVTINGKKYDVIVLYSPSPNALRGVSEEDREKQYKEVFGK